MTGRKKHPGMTWDGSAWRLRVQKRRGSLTIERTKTVKGGEAEALAALARLHKDVEDELDRRLRGAPTPGTLTEYVEPWLASLRKRGKTVEFLTTRGDYLERFILPFFGHMEPAAIRPRHFDAWKGWLLARRQPDRLGKRKNPRAGQPYAHETLLSVWSCMRQFMRFVVVEEEIVHPMDNVRFDVKGAPPVEKDVLDADELGRLIAAARDESDDIRTMLIVGFGLGLRFSELSALWWGDIDLVKGVLRIERSQVKGREGPPKTEASRRLVYLPPEIVDALKRHREWQIREQAPGFEKGWVFPSRKGTYRSPSVLTRPLERCCARAGIDKKLSAHCLRHTANDLLRQVASEIVVRAMVGHSTPAMTRRYSHVKAQERAEAHRRAFGDALKSGTTP